jgi:hypothetical protein
VLNLQHSLVVSRRHSLPCNLLRSQVASRQCSPVASLVLSLRCNHHRSHRRSLVLNLQHILVVSRRRRPPCNLLPSPVLSRLCSPVASLVPSLRCYHHRSHRRNPVLNLLDNPVTNPVASLPCSLRRAPALSPQGSRVVGQPNNRLPSRRSCLLRSRRLHHRDSRRLLRRHSLLGSPVILPAPCQPHSLVNNPHGYPLIDLQCNLQSLLVSSRRDSPLPTRHHSPR